MQEVTPDVRLLSPGREREKGGVVALSSIVALTRSDSVHLAGALLPNTPLICARTLSELCKWPERLPEKHYLICHHSESHLSRPLMPLRATINAAAVTHPRVRARPRSQLRKSLNVSIQQKKKAARLPGLLVFSEDGRKN